MRRSEELAKAGRRFDQPSEALLKPGFRGCSNRIRRFCERSRHSRRPRSGLVVELGETAQTLARRYPANAEAMVRRLGPEGLSAVRVFGDDVAEVLVKEGPESMSVLRKAGARRLVVLHEYGLTQQEEAGRRGRAGGVPGQPREVRRLRRPGHRVRRPRVRQGRHSACLGRRAGRSPRAREFDRQKPWPSYGLNFPVLRWLGMGLAAIVAAGALMIVLGLPVRWLLRPFAMYCGPLDSCSRRVIETSSPRQFRCRLTRSIRSGSLGSSAMSKTKRRASPARCSGSSPHGPEAGRALRSSQCGQDHAARDVLSRGVERPLPRAADGGGRRAKRRVSRGEDRPDRVEASRWPALSPRPS